MFLVDSNIFLEILLDQEKAGICQTFLEQTQQKNCPIVCTHFSIHSIAVRLSSKKKFDQLHDFIQSIQNMPNLTVYSTNLEEERFVVKLCKKMGLDFDDALQYHITKTYNCKGIVSYDSDFDKTDITRITPELALVSY